MFRPKRSNYKPYEEMVDKLLLKETADEMFKFLSYELVHDHKHSIRYEQDEGDMCYHFINFHPVLKELEFGFYDGYETKREEPARIDIILLIPVVKKMEELGWTELDRKDEVVANEK